MHASETYRLIGNTFAPPCRLNTTLRATRLVLAVFEAEIIFQSKKRTILNGIGHTGWNSAYMLTFFRVRLSPFVEQICQSVRKTSLLFVFNTRRNIYYTHLISWDLRSEEKFTGAR